MRKMRNTQIEKNHKGKANNAHKMWKPDFFIEIQQYYNESTEVTALPSSFNY
jgi:hypothetical protein